MKSLATTKYKSLNKIYLSFYRVKPSVDDGLLMFGFIGYEVGVETGVFCFVFVFVVVIGVVGVGAGADVDAVGVGVVVAVVFVILVTV